MKSIIKLLVVCVLLSSCHALGIRNPFAGKSLYDRLGGISHIAVLVDEFSDKVMHDEAILANPAVAEAMGRIPIAPLKYHLTSLVCYATGGPETYTGRSLDEAHAGLNITEAEWQRMIDLLTETLTSLSIKPEDQAELLELIHSVKPEIVGK